MASAGYRQMVARRREQVAELTRQGWNVKQIQDALGCSSSIVRRDRQETGTAKLWRGQLSPEERQQRVAELTRQGMSLAQIADILKVTERTVQRDRRDIGIARPTPRWLTPEETVKVHQLLDEGTSLAEAARSIGRSENALYSNSQFRGRAWTPQQIAEFATVCRRLGNCG